MLPSPIVSSGSILALWFTTDFAVSAQGFKAVYEGKTVCEDEFDARTAALRDKQTVSRLIEMCCKVSGLENVVGLIVKSELKTAGKQVFTTSAAFRNNIWFIGK